MQVLQAGDRKLLLLELEPHVIEGIARQLGFELRDIEETSRSIVAELRANGRLSPLLLFDASEPANLGWFSRCQFYVDARTGSVLQTPIRLANVRERGVRLLPDAVRIQIDKELPERFRVPGRQPLGEQAIYAIFYNLLTALLETGVAVCGTGVVGPLAGRGQNSTRR